MEKLTYEANLLLAKPLPEEASAELSSPKIDDDIYCVKDNIALVDKNEWKMKLIYILFILLCITTNTHAQIENIGDETLMEKIKQSDKSYKLIYIFCNYCQVSQTRYPEVVKAVQNNKNVEVFFICAQDSSEIALYADTCKVTSSMYLINQYRKRKRVSFYNPIKATCKYLKKQLEINTDKMGASDFCIIDKENKIIAQTDWEMKDAEYFKLLNESLATLKKEVGNR